MFTTVGIIPARYASTRFPGKPLALIQNKPMIQWVYENTLATTLLDEVIVATDDVRIQEVVHNFGGKAVLTSITHESGTERCAEIVHKLLQNKQVDGNSIIINIQGDEPLVNVQQLQTLLHTMQYATIATLIKATEASTVHNPNIVKVVTNIHHQALYFSRAAIPASRDEQASASYYKHIGMYAYTVETLLAITKLPICDVENIEKLEQLRWLYNGYSIHTAITTTENKAIDTPQDLIELVAYLEKNSIHLP